MELGEFGAEMAVELVNDGPFTIWLDTADRSASAWRRAARSHGRSRQRPTTRSPEAHEKPAACATGLRARTG